MKSRKEFRKNYNVLERAVTHKKRSCAYPGCDQLTINSHAISEAFLSMIAEDGHVRMLHNHPYKGLEFCSVGIREATVFSGFCSFHDSTLFAGIDSKQVEFQNLQNLMLLNYRATVCEMVKKMNRRETYSRTIDPAKELSHPMARHFESRAEEYLFNFEVSQWYCQELLSGVAAGNSRFDFNAVELPYHDIIVSEHFTFEPDASIRQKRNEFRRDRSSIDPFSELYIHLFPKPDKSGSLLVISMHEKDRKILADFTDRLLGLPVEKMISGLLVLYLEGWACSEEFYHHHLSPKEESFFSIIRATAGQCAFDRQTEFDLFRS